MAAQAALSKRGVAVLIVPVDVSRAHVAEDVPFAVHVGKPLVRPSDAELDRIVELLNAGTRITIYGGSGCAGAHDEIVNLAGALLAPVAHTSRAKDFLEYDNPYDERPVRIAPQSCSGRADREPSHQATRPRLSHWPKRSM